MVKSFNFLPDIATADVAFEAKGNSLNEVFEASAEALCEVMAKRSTIKPTKKKKIQLSAETYDQLLFDFLSELIFMKDVDAIVFSAVKVDIKEQQKKISLKATAEGAPINPSTQELGNDVKAVTLHMFSLKKEGNQWRAHIVLDI
mgnify:CR=1 FL=1